MTLEQWLAQYTLEELNGFGYVLAVEAYYNTKAEITKYQENQVEKGGS